MFFLHLRKEKLTWAFESNKQVNKAKKAIVILFILRNYCKFKKTCDRTRLSDIDDERSVVVSDGNWLVLPFPDKGVDATFIVALT